MVLQNEAELRVGDMTAASGSVVGAGSLVVEDEFAKVADDTSPSFAVTNQAIGTAAPDLVLEGPSSMTSGQLCIARSDDASPDLPSMTIDDTFTFTDPGGTLGSMPFNCTSGPRIRVTGTGHLIHAAEREIRLGTMIDNDGAITAQAGKLVLSGGTSTGTSAGDYLAADDAVLQFGTCCSEAFSVGPTGSVGGPGRIIVSGPVTLADGATLTPGVLDLPFSTLTLLGSADATLAKVNITGGVLDSERDVSITALAVTAGAIQREFTLTVPAGGSFSKTGDSAFFIRNNGALGSADLVLDTDATLDGGSFCVGRDGDQDPDLPGLHINQDLTIGAGAAGSALGCSGVNPVVHVNGPAGQLKKTGAGVLGITSKLDVAGGTVTVANGQTFTLTNGMTQSAGLTEIASGGVVQTPSGIVALGGGALAGAGQITGTLSNTGGTVRPAGTLAVSGPFTQGAGGTLEIDLATGAQDRLTVTGAASLAGTLAALPASGFDPVAGATFPVVTSGSRTGTFTTLSGTRLPAGKRLALDHPGSPDFGARLVVTPPTDFVVTDCDDPALATVTEVTGDLVVDAVPACDAVELPALTEVSGDITIADNPSAGVIDLGGLESAAVINISGNTDASVIDMGGLESAAVINIAGNGAAEIDLGSLEDVSGDLAFETTGAGEIDLGDAAVGGDETLDTTGYDSVGGTTAGGATTVESEHAEALMRAVLPAGAFTAPVRFAVTRIDPAALPPEGSVDPVAAYAFEFGVPTLNSPAELTFAVRLSGLDGGTRDALLAALEGGRATLATRGDAAGSAYQAFPVCAAGVAPSADGCVRVERTSDDVVRFSGVVGHFSTWAVAIVAPSAPPDGGGGTTPPPPPAPPAFGTRTLVTLTPAASRIRKRGPLRVRIANRNAFAVAARAGGRTVAKLGKRRVTLRTRSLRVPANATRTVSLALPKAVQQRLKRPGRIVLRLSAVVTDPAGNRRTVTRRVLVRRR